MTSNSTTSPVILPGMYLIGGSICSPTLIELPLLSLPVAVSDDTIQDLVVKAQDKGDLPNGSAAAFLLLQ